MRIVSVVAARPNFVKLAAVHHDLERHAPKLEHVIVHTGQHYDPLLFDVFFEQLAIPMPSVNLGIHGEDRGEVIARTEAALIPHLQELRPGVVLVYGDVNGALGAARAAKRNGVCLGHVEAGLRSFDLTMPEERNRIGIDEMADRLFVSEESGMENLANEKVPGEAHLVGNTMIDTLLRMMPLIEREPLPSTLKKPFGVVTLHRPSNVDTPDILANVLRFLGEVAKRCPLVLPAHHRLTLRLKECGLESEVPKGLSLIDPLGYVPFLNLMKHAAFVLTDSGGIQEEAVFLQKKCFTLRRNTERPVTVESGSNTIVDPAVPEDREEVLSFAVDPVTPSITIPPLWDGRAGQRIIEIITSQLS